MGTARAARVMLLVGLATVLGGCASTGSVYVTKFQASMLDLQEGVENEASLGVAAARARFVEEMKAKVKTTDGIALVDLQLQFDAPYGYRYLDGKEPLYATLERFQRGLGNLNRAMADYAALLVQLAGDEATVTAQQAQLDAMRTKINATATKAATDFDVETKTGTGGNEVPFPAGLLSNAAMDIFEAAIDGRRRRDLAAATREVQPTMVAYSEKVRSALQQLAIGIRLDYDDRVEPLMLPPGDVDGLLELNEETEGRLRLLAALDESYRKLPAAHADLAASFGRQAVAQAGLDAFAAETKRVQALAAALADSR